MTFRFLLLLLLNDLYEYLIVKNTNLLYLTVHIYIYIYYMLNEKIIYLNINMILILYENMIYIK